MVYKQARPSPEVVNADVIVRRIRQGGFNPALRSRNLLPSRNGEGPIPSLWWIRTERVGRRGRYDPRIPRNAHDSHPSARPQIQLLLDVQTSE